MWCNTNWGQLLQPAPLSIALLGSVLIIAASTEDFCKTFFHDFTSSSLTGRISSCHRTRPHRHQSRFHLAVCLIPRQLQDLPHANVSFSAASPRWHTDFLSGWAMGTRPSKAPIQACCVFKTTPVKSPGRSTWPSRLSFKELLRRSVSISVGKSTVFYSWPITARGLPKSVKRHLRTSLGWPKSWSSRVPTRYEFSPEIRNNLVEVQGHQVGTNEQKLEANKAHLAFLQAQKEGGEIMLKQAEDSLKFMKEVSNCHTAPFISSSDGNDSPAI